MRHNYGDCYFCGGKVISKTTTVDYWWRGKLYLFRDVPAGVCKQCGEKYFKAKVAKEMERMVRAKEKWGKTIPVPVESFPKTIEV